MFIPGISLSNFAEPCLRHIITHCAHFITWLLYGIIPTMYFPYFLQPPLSSCNIALFYNIANPGLINWNTGSQSFVQLVLRHWQVAEFLIFSTVLNKFYGSLTPPLPYCTNNSEWRFPYSGDWSLMNWIWDVPNCYRRQESWPFPNHLK